MNRYENWTIKKAKCQIITAFELWCWRRLLRVPWTSRRLNQSILKGINPEYSLEGLMLNLKLQYFVHLMQSADSLEKTLMLEKTEGRRRRDWQDEMVGWHHQLNGHEFEQTVGDSEGQGSLVCCSSWGHKESDTTERLSNSDRVTSSRTKLRTAEWKLQRAQGPFLFSQYVKQHCELADLGNNNYVVSV